MKSRHGFINWKLCTLACPTILVSILATWPRASMALPPSGSATDSDARSQLVELTEVHEQLKASAIKLEMAFQGCFTEYVGQQIQLQQCAGMIQSCDAAYTQRTEQLDKCTAELSNASGWLGLPGWAWALIGVGAGAVGATVLFASVTR